MEGGCKILGIAPRAVLEEIMINDGASEDFEYNFSTCTLYQCGHTMSKYHSSEHQETLSNKLVEGQDVVHLRMFHSTDGCEFLVTK